MSQAKLSVENATIRFNNTDVDIFRSIVLDSVSTEVIPTNNDQLDRKRAISIEYLGMNELKKEFDIYLPQNSTSMPEDEDLSKIIDEFDLLQPLMTSAVPLSTSVGVSKASRSSNSLPAIEIVNKLETNYKPRYKSDYFSQDGRIRRPRYVADRDGNHYVSLKIRSDLQGYIRIDWVTIEDEHKQRYSMPYKFQINNDDRQVPDVNPLLIQISPDSNGIMQVYLALIKSKLDELVQMKTLASFPPIEDQLKSSTKSISSSKDLIKNYQLNKSQLAFTYCSLNSDRQTCTIHWNTTVYSTILTEQENHKRKVCCPICKHKFEISGCDIDDTIHVQSIKRKR